MPPRYSRGALGINWSPWGRQAPAIGYMNPRKTVRSGAPGVGEAASVAEATALAVDAGDAEPEPPQAARASASSAGREMRNERRSRRPAFRPGFREGRYPV